jgi:hypothetical protein
MKKLVALEKIKGMFSGIVYAEKHDELEFLKEHDDEISMYRNLRTHEPFHCKKEKVGEVEQSDIFFLVDEEVKKLKESRRKIDTGNDNQMSLFIKS